MVQHDNRFFAYLNLQQYFGLQVYVWLNSFGQFFYVYKSILFEMYYYIWENCLIIYVTFMQFNFVVLLTSYIGCMLLFLAFMG